MDSGSQDGSRPLASPRRSAAASTRRTLATLKAEAARLRDAVAAGRIEVRAETAGLADRITSLEGDAHQVAVRSGEGLTGWVARNRRPLVNGYSAFIPRPFDRAMELFGGGVLGAPRSRCPRCAVFHPCFSGSAFRADFPVLFAPAA